VSSSYFMMKALGFKQLRDFEESQEQNADHVFEN
jgi:hypothetical protein